MQGLTIGGKGRPTIRLSLIPVQGLQRQSLSIGAVTPEHQDTILERKRDDTQIDLALEVAEGQLALSAIGCLWPNRIENQDLSVFDALKPTTAAQVVKVHVRRGDVVRRTVSPAAG